MNKQKMLTMNEIFYIVKFIYNDILCVIYIQAWYFLLDAFSKPVYIVVDQSIALNCMLYLLTAASTYPA